jgi:hypothetical protein
MCAGVSIHRSAHYRAAGSGHDLEHDKGVRWKGEEHGKSAFERETSSRIVEVVGMAARSR